VTTSSGSPSIADLLEATTRELAGTDARVYRRVGEHISKTAAVAEELNDNSNTNRKAAPALLGTGSFKQQSLKTLRGLCKENGIKGYSKLNKSSLTEVLEAHGVTPPPRPLESMTKKELIALVRALMA